MQRRGRGKKRPAVREAARNRIETLYGLAFDKAKEGDLQLARRYLGLARKVGMRYTVRIPPDLKRSTCKSCLIPLIPDVTARIRLRNESLAYTCLECGRIARHPLKGGIKGDQEE